MGEFSTVFAIRSILEKQPSICIRGIKLQHLKAALKELDIDFGKEDAEMDIITINFNKDKVNILFGECKVKRYIKSSCMVLIWTQILGPFDTFLQQILLVGNKTKKLLR